MRPIRQLSLLFLLLCACGCAAVSSPGEEGAEIRFMVESSEAQRYQALAEQFQAMQPNLTIAVEGVDYSRYAFSEPPVLYMAHASDCFLGYAHVLDASTQHEVVEIGELLKADQSVAVGDFFPSTLEPFILQEDKLYGLPADVVPHVIEYNKELFDAAGVSYPSPDWSWDDFQAKSIAVARDPEKVTGWYGYLPGSGEKYTMLLMFERMGAGLIDGRSDSWRISFDDPATVEAMRRYYDLAAEHGVKPVLMGDGTSGRGALSYWRAGQYSDVKEGGAAMWMPEFWKPEYYGFLKFDIGIVPLPSGPVDVASYSWPRGYFISSQTSHVEACWQWIAFLVQQPPADSYRFPAHRLTAESEAYVALVGEERAAAYWASVAGDRPAPFTVSAPLWLRLGVYGLFPYENVFQEGLNKASRDAIDMDTAIEAAQKAADTYCVCMRNRLQEGELVFEQKFDTSSLDPVPLPVPYNVFLAFDEPVACFHQAVPADWDEPLELWGPYRPRNPD